ncbi:MAG: ureidoglycolate hydrolase [Alphaproteobacteria bacterium]|nr:MAG: ureidoglycolate hydrolase [Alphaproteobacteria bacterium]
MSLDIRKIPVVRATRENLDGLGQLIDIEPGDAKLQTAFYEGTVRVYSPCSFMSDEDTEIVVASVDRRPLKVRWLERHFKHTQTFFPFSGRPFIVVMAPPTTGDLPDIDEVRAFLFDGTGGFMMHVGTWHEFPFALVDDTRLAILLRKEATRNLLKDAAIAGEAHGPDLDKKDIVQRLGIEFEAIL